MIGQICTVYLLCAGIFSLFINLLNLTVPLYMLSLMRKVLRGGGTISSVYSLTLIAIVALLTLAILDFIRSRLLIQAGIKMNSMLSRKVVQATLKELSRADGSGSRQGLADLSTLQNFFSGNAVSAFFDIPWIFIYLGIMFLMHPLLGAAASAGAAVILIMGFLQKRLTKGYLKKTNVIKNQDRHLLQKSSRTSEMLKCMGMIRNAAQLRNRIDDQEAGVRYEPEKKEHIFGACSAAFTLFMKISIYALGALLVLNHECSMGVVFAASIIMGQALSPVNQSIFALKEISEASVAYRRLKILLNSSKQEGLKRVDHIAGKIELKEAGLELRGTTVLENINFHLNPGEMMGLVGNNGAGKSCLCRMILGVWLPSSGSVCIDDQNTSSLNQDSLGAFTGYLPQDVQLFPGTVSHNIARLGADKPGMVIEAAESAGAHSMILGLPKGYDTDIGDAGKSISGGQRQRIALARALYSHPSLVVLDEPDSNLDKEGEIALTACLNKLKNEKTTTIMITHKAELLHHVDKVLVLDKGRVSFFGTEKDFSKEIRK